MTTIFPGMMRHAIFGDETSPDKMNVVPETEVVVSLLRHSSGVKIVAKFKGQTVILPAGSAVQYIYIQAITASGAIGYADPESPSPPLPPSILRPRN